MHARIQFYNWVTLIKTALLPVKFNQIVIFRATIEKEDVNILEKETLLTVERFVIALFFFFFNQCSWDTVI